MTAFTWSPGGCCCDVGCNIISGNTYVGTLFLGGFRGPFACSIMAPESSPCFGEVAIERQYFWHLLNAMFQGEGSASGDAVCLSFDTGYRGYYPEYGIIIQRDTWYAEYLDGVLQCSIPYEIYELRVTGITACLTCCPHLIPPSLCFGYGCPVNVSYTLNLDYYRSTYPHEEINYVRLPGFGGFVTVTLDPATACEPLIGGILGQSVSASSDNETIWVAGCDANFLVLDHPGATITVGPIE